MCRLSDICEYQSDTEFEVLYHQEKAKRVFLQTAEYRNMSELKKCMLKCISEYFVRLLVLSIERCWIFCWGGPN